MVSHTTEESNFDIVLIKFKPNIVRNVNPKFETLRNKMKITSIFKCKDPLTIGMILSSLAGLNPPQGFILTHKAHTLWVRTKP